MRFKFNKEIEYLFKKFFIPEKYLLKKRLIRAYKKKYEEELLFLDKIVISLIFNFFNTLIYSSAIYPEPTINTDLF